MNKITKRILEANFLNKMFKSPFKIIDECLAYFFRRYVRLKTKVENNKIMIATFNGQFNCNPKAILQEILKQNMQWKIVWVIQEDEDIKDIPKSVKIVKKESADFYTEAYSSKIWIANSIMLTDFGLKKKSNQIMIQTWHGSIGIKRFETTTKKKWIRQAKESAKETDYCISNSKFEDDLYKNTFWKNSEILTLGHARNDILFKINDKDTTKIKDEIRERLNIPKNAKVALYAPTFRDSKNLDCYNIDYNAVKNALTQKFGGDWVILNRLHNRIRGMFIKYSSTLPDFVLNGNTIKDIQEMLLITDVGITDYSSWICDYMLMKKPGFIFATDLKKYNTERGFYYPLKELPFPIAENNEQLVNNILNFDEQKFVEKANLFLEEKGSIDDGYASERIVSKLNSLLKNRK